MPATSRQLNAPVRSRAEYLAEKMASGEPMTAEETREWLDTSTDSFRHAPEKPDVDLRGSAAIGAAYVSGLTPNTHLKTLVGIGKLFFPDDAA